MFKSRLIQQHINWLDDTGVKIYSISATNQPVDQTEYLPMLAKAKAAIDINWETTPSFAIFHDGAQYPYLILCWWQNDNELFNRVFVKDTQAWSQASDKYSFCLYDLEVIWIERNIFIDTIDNASPSLQDYQNTRRTLK